MAIGNQPSLTGNVASKTISITATASQTLFTVTGGYRINQLSVYRNGTRLVDSLDYTARDGSSVTLLSPATLYDVLEFQVFDDFRVADAIVSAASNQTIFGNLTVTGTIFGSNLSLTGIATATTFVGALTGNATGLSGTPNITVGVVTASSVIVGSAVTINSSGINVTGITTIKNASGTVTIGIGTTALLVEGNARVTGILTVGSSSITLNGITDTINVGTGLTLSSGGINITGVITATSFVGSGSGLTGVGLGTTGSINTSGIITATSVVVSAGTTAAPSISPTGDTNTGIFFPSADTVAISEGGTEALRVDSSGRLLVGTTSSDAQRTASVQIASAGGLSGWGSSLNLTEFGASYNPYLVLQRSRNGTIGSHTVLQSGDLIGGIQFNGSDGDSFEPAATINAFVDGTPGANDMPGRLVFSTTSDGSSSPTERIRLDSSGRMLVGTTSANGNSKLQAVNSGDVVFLVNRETDDGNLVVLLQAGNTEGTISVSGTTVSYNGAHLSRWSQLPSGAERTEILRGSVLSNLDEMCEWGEEDNEQLNRMKVSEVEGDKNVSGVFQCWDDDDDTYTNDFYCAMTGDFIIRIADGVTVERGDLLMSAGDGTAKPQDDDIVRSKTVAKVTSTNVTCTYEDGSYCVPCVLMAC